MLVGHWLAGITQSKVIVVDVFNIEHALNVNEQSNIIKQ